MKSSKALGGGFLLLALLFSAFPFAHSSSLNGGNGLTYVKSAWNLKQGYLTLYGRKM